MIEINNVSKIYNQHAALQNINISLRQGVVAVIGPNGAGKTTLFSLCSGLDVPSRGTVMVCGHDPYRQHDKVAQIMGVLPEVDGLIEGVPLNRQLEIYGGLFGLGGDQAKRRAIECISALNLEDNAHTMPSRMSKGMRKRSALARALLHDPQILILDEPTDGLDPIQVVSLRNLLIELKKCGKLILFNSHNLSEVARISDTIVVMSKGSVIFAGNKERFTENSPRVGDEFSQMEVAYNALFERSQAIAAG